MDTRSRQNITPQAMGNTTWSHLKVLSVSVFSEIPARGSKIHSKRGPQGKDENGDAFQERPWPQSQAIKFWGLIYDISNWQCQNLETWQTLFFIYHLKRREKLPVLSQEGGLIYFE
jgi:hypothetical protein